MFATGSHNGIVRIWSRPTSEDGENLRHEVPPPLKSSRLSTSFDLSGLSMGSRQGSSVWCRAVRWNGEVSMRKPSIVHFW